MKFMLHTLYRSFRD